MSVWIENLTSSVTMNASIMMPFWEKRHFIFIDFACRAKSKDVRLNEEGQRHVWASLEEAEKLPLGKFTKNLIET